MLLSPSSHVLRALTRRRFDAPRLGRPMMAARRSRNERSSASASHAASRRCSLVPGRLIRGKRPPHERVMLPACERAPRHPASCRDLLVGQVIVPQQHGHLGQMAEAASAWRLWRARKATETRRGQRPGDERPLIVRGSLCDTSLIRRMRHVSARSASAFRRASSRAASSRKRAANAGSCCCQRNSVRR